MKRSSVSRLAAAASSTLAVPSRLTRIVRTGLLSTESTPAMAAMWTMCVAPSAAAASAAASRMSPLQGLDVGVRREVGVAQRVAREVVVEDDVVVVDQPAGERAADEAGAARDQHAFALERHGGGEV